MTTQRSVAAPEGRRIVVKIGSRSLVGADAGRFAQIATQVLALRAQGRQNRR